MHAVNEYAIDLNSWPKCNSWLDLCEQKLNEKFVANSFVA